MHESFLLQKQLLTGLGGTAFRMLQFNLTALDPIRDNHHHDNTCVGAQHGPNQPSQQEQYLRWRPVWARPHTS